MTSPELDHRTTYRVWHTRLQTMTPLRSFPDWWEWELAFSGHAELRMEQRGVSETDVRGMLTRATALEASAARVVVVVTVDENLP